MQGPNDAGAFPSGFVHLPTTTSGHDLVEVLEQLTAEALVEVAQKNGFSRHEWRKTRQRNEGLDCAVYARAAAYHPKVGMAAMTPARWETLAAERGSPVETGQLDLLRAAAGAAGTAKDGGRGLRQRASRLAKLNG